MLIRLPDDWPQPLVAALAMVLLAGLDLAGALAAKEAVERRSPELALAGAAFFLLLFWVYASSLQYVDLAPVTLGWIVVLQLSVLALDTLRYGAVLPAGAWVAVGVILAAQAYLVLAPRPPSDPPRDVAGWTASR